MNELNCGLVCGIEKIFKIRANTVLKMKLVRENAVTRAHKSCSLRVMGS